MLRQGAALVVGRARPRPLDHVLLSPVQAAKADWPGWSSFNGRQALTRACLEEGRGLWHGGRTGHSCHKPLSRGSLNPRIPGVEPAAACLLACGRRWRPAMPVGNRWSCLKATGRRALPSAPPRWGPAAPTPPALLRPTRPSGDCAAVAAACGGGNQRTAQSRCAPSQPGPCRPGHRTPGILTRMPGLARPLPRRSHLQGTPLGYASRRGPAAPSAPPPAARALWGPSSQPWASAGPCPAPREQPVTDCGSAERAWLPGLKARGQPSPLSSSPCTQPKGWVHGCGGSPSHAARSSPQLITWLLVRSAGSSVKRGRPLQLLPLAEVGRWPLWPLSPSSPTSLSPGPCNG